MYLLWENVCSVLIFWWGCLVFIVEFHENFILYISCLYIPCCKIDFLPFSKASFYLSRMSFMVQMFLSNTVSLACTLFFHSIFMMLLLNEYHEYFYLCCPKFILWVRVIFHEHFCMVWDRGLFFPLIFFLYGRWLSSFPGLLKRPPLLYLMFLAHLS